MLRTLEAVIVLFVPESAEDSALHILERDWHNDIMVMVRERLPKVAVVLFLLFVLQRIVQFFVNRMVRAAARTTTNPSRGAQLRTMSTLIRGTSYSVLGFMAFLQVLNLFAIPYTGLLASAGLLGVGIGLAAQSLFKDIINGVLIFVEDQYNVGEVVRIASLTGTVEDLTLRLTRLREGDGTLHIIPNSQIATVSNLSRDYSVATLPVSVDASANPDMVMAQLREIAASLRSDSNFADVLIAAPEILGVDKIDGRSILYPINLRVRPNQKDGVLRELRKRIVLKFEERGIPLGTDASMLVMQAPKDPTAPPSQQPLVGS
jgi:small-conductance mechanosensitive channel